jgi:bifunctional non-homologous end joining protein LigD
VAKEHVIVEAAGHELRVSSPSKVFFPERGLTKLDLVNYYLECEGAVVRHLRDRPTVMKRWVDGVEGEPFFQKRVPATAPDWLQTATVTFPSGRHARELVPNDAAHLVWGVNLGVIDWNPWPVRRSDLDHPDELRVDLDPGPDVPFAEVREVALEVRAVLEEHGLRGFPKTSGSRGMHVYVRIEPSQSFEEVRRSALALAREVERRMPRRATSRWWKEEREGVFIDYNQNARDRTIASAYSVRAVPDARVSCPVEWDEVADLEPGELTMETVPARLRKRGDPSAAIDEHHYSLDALLELAARDEREGLGDAPWPPHFRKMEGEAPRVAPSRAKSIAKKPPREKMPLIVVANSPDKNAALAGLDKWKAKHAQAAGFLAVDDVLVDSMRGRSSTWTRIRVNLRHVPEALRPPQETPDPDDDPTREWRSQFSARRKK